jgi:hypothetical protein
VAAVIGMVRSRFRLKIQTNLFIQSGKQSGKGGKMIERLTVLIFTISIAACASTGPETASTASGETAQAEETAVSEGGVESTDAEQMAAANEEPEDEMVCRREKRVGSNFTRKVCYPRSALEGRAAQDQEALRQMRSLSPSSTQEFGGQ